MQRLWQLFQIAFFLAGGGFAVDSDTLQDICVADLRDAIHVNGYLCKDATLVSSSDFAFQGFRSNAGGNNNATLQAAMASVLEFPALNSQGLSMVKVVLQLGALIPPHLHPRSSELVMVLQGQVKAGFITTSNTVYSQQLSEGDLFIVPRGLVHFQMNSGNSQAIVIGSFNSQNPGFQALPSALFGTDLDDEVLMKSFALSHRALQGLKSKFKSP